LEIPLEVTRNLKVVLLLRVSQLSAMTHHNRLTIEHGAEVVISAAT
jgi:hypothetical protein